MLSFSAKRSNEIFSVGQSLPALFAFLRASQGGVLCLYWRPLCNPLFDSLLFKWYNCWSGAAVSSPLSRTYMYSPCIQGYLVSYIRTNHILEGFWVLESSEDIVTEEIGFTSRRWLSRMFFRSNLFLFNDRLIDLILIPVCNRGFSASAYSCPIWTRRHAFGGFRSWEAWLCDWGAALCGVWRKTGLCSLLFHLRRTPAFIPFDAATSWPGQGSLALTRIWWKGWWRGCSAQATGEQLLRSCDGQKEGATP